MSGESFLSRYRLLVTAVSVVGAAALGYYTYSRIYESRVRLRMRSQTPPPGLSLSSHDVEKAKSLKSQGNQAYTQGDLIKATQLYSEALLNYPEFDPDRVFTLCNRAACLLAKRDFSGVVSDCSEALALSPMYIKALHRRARAYEALGLTEDALVDYTACCVIESFSNPSMIQSLENALKTAAETKAASALKTRAFSLPSHYAISEFFKAFPLDSSENDIARLVMDGEYVLADEMTSSGQNISSVFYRACFMFLKGLVDETRELCDVLLGDEEPIWNLRGAILTCLILTERGQIGEAKEILNSAARLKLSGECLAYVWFHLAETCAMESNFNNAMAFYDKAIKMCPGKPVFYLHKARTATAVNMIEEGEASIQEALERFPEDPDLVNALGEVSIFKGELDSALEIFKDCLDLCESRLKIQSPPTTFLNMAILALSFIGQRSDSNDKLSIDNIKSQAVEFLERALKIDPLFEPAHVQLANLFVGEGRIEEARKHYECAVQSSRSLQDIVQILTVQLASFAQYHVSQQSPELAAKIKLFLFLF